LDFRKFPTKGPGHSIVFAALGFGFAGVAGLLVGALFLRSGLTGLIVGLVDQAQPLQRLLVAIILLVFGLAISGAVTGGIAGWLLSLVDARALRRRYVWAGAVSYAIPQTVVTSRGILVLSVLSVYYNNLDTQNIPYALLFGFFGMTYGLIAGIIFGFSSVGFKYGWSVLLGSIVGGMFGGILSGMLTRLLVNGAIRADQPLHYCLLMVLSAFVYFAVIGAAMGLIYAWFNRQRQQGGDLPQRMTRFWRVMIIFASTLLFLDLFGSAYSLYTFAGVYPPSTAPVIAPEAIGVAWNEPADLGKATASSPPAIAAGPDKEIALVWADQGASGGVIMFARGISDGFAAPDWRATSVISSPESDAVRPPSPQIARAVGTWSGRKLIRPPQRPTASCTPFVRAMTARSPFHYRIRRQNAPQATLRRRLRSLPSIRRARSWSSGRVAMTGCSLYPGKRGKRRPPGRHACATADPNRSWPRLTPGNSFSLSRLNPLSCSHFIVNRSGSRVPSNRRRAMIPLSFMMLVMIVSIQPGAMKTVGSIIGRRNPNKSHPRRSSILLPVHPDPRWRVMVTDGCTFSGIPMRS